MATGRPRGFIKDWTPSHTIRTDDFGEPLFTHSPAGIVNAVREILDDNGDILPLTLRQIFYMMVSNYGYDKTEKAYKRLCETMNKARRAQHIPMESIRDDGFTQIEPHCWQTEGQLINTFKNSADRFRLDRQDGQDTRLFIWCEAGGMAPQLAAAVKDYGVTVLSSGGFDSLTTKHDMAEEIANYDRVEILHIGDHDPSGVHICSSLDQDLQAFVDYYGGEVEVTRLAVTPEQVEEMDLPTAPPKSTDKRSFSGRTTQAEAIPPRRLREIVTDAVTDRINTDEYDHVLEQELEIRERLNARLSEL